MQNGMDDIEEVYGYGYSYQIVLKVTPEDNQTMSYLKVHCVIFSPN